MPDIWLTAVLRHRFISEYSSNVFLYAFLLLLSAYLLLCVSNRRRSRQNNRSDWPYIKFDTVGRIGRRQIIEEIRLADFPTSIEAIFAILDSTSSRILWINESTFLSINGWSIKRFMETSSDIHRMLALDFTCSRKNGPWKRIHIYSRSSQTAFDTVLLLMSLTHQFNAVDISCHTDINESEPPLVISALTPQLIKTMLTLQMSCDIEIGFEGLHLGPEQSSALAQYSHSLNLGHDTTIDGLSFISALRNREQPICSLSFRERSFDDVNWSLFLAHLANPGKSLVRSLTLFHGCFVGPHDCSVLVNAQVERLIVQSACFHDEGEALVQAVALGSCPSHLHLIGYQPDIFVRVVHALTSDGCTLKSLRISLSGSHSDSLLQPTLQLALEENSSLEALTIDNVSDVSEWVQTFAPLASNRTLTKLSLNNIEQTSNEAAQEIVRLLESNRNLEIVHSFSGSPRKQCRDAWSKTIDQTLRFNRFFRNVAPFSSKSGDHYREAIFSAALARNRNDSRRLALLLFQNADLLTNLRPLKKKALQHSPFWVVYTDKLAQLYQTQKQKINRWMHAFQEYVQAQADDVGYRLGDALIFSHYEWNRESETGAAAE